MSFDFLRPKDCVKLRESPCHVNGFQTFIYDLFCRAGRGCESALNLSLVGSLSPLEAGDGVIPANLANEIIISPLYY